MTWQGIYRSGALGSSDVRVAVQSCTQFLLQSCKEALCLRDASCLVPLDAILHFRHESAKACCCIDLRSQRPVLFKENIAIMFELLIQPCAQQNCPTFERFVSGACVAMLLPNSAINVCKLFKYHCIGTRVFQPPSHAALLPDATTSDTNCRARWFRT